MPGPTIIPWWEDWDSKYGHNPAKTPTDWFEDYVPGNGNVGSSSGSGYAPYTTWYEYYWYDTGDPAYDGWLGPIDVEIQTIPPPLFTFTSDAQAGMVHGASRSSTITITVEVYPADIYAGSVALVPGAHLTQMAGSPVTTVENNTETTVYTFYADATCKTTARATLVNPRNPYYGNVWIDDIVKDCTIEVYGEEYYTSDPPPTLSPEVSYSLDPPECWQWSDIADGSTLFLAFDRGRGHLSDYIRIAGSLTDTDTHYTWDWTNWHYVSGGVNDGSWQAENDDQETPAPMRCVDSIAWTDNDFPEGTQDGPTSQSLNVLLVGVRIDGLPASMDRCTTAPLVAVPLPQGDARLQGGTFLWRSLMPDRIRFINPAWPDFGEPHDPGLIPPCPCTDALTTVTGQAVGVVAVDNGEVPTTATILVAWVTPPDDRLTTLTLQATASTLTYERYWWSSKPDATLALMEDYADHEPGVLGTYPPSPLYSANGLIKRYFVYDPAKATLADYPKPGGWRAEVSDQDWRWTSKHRLILLDKMVNDTTWYKALVDTDVQPTGPGEYVIGATFHDWNDTCANPPEDPDTNDFAEDEHGGIENVQAIVVLTSTTIVGLPTYFWVGHTTATIQANIQPESAIADLQECDWLIEPAVPGGTPGLRFLLDDGTLALHLNGQATQATVVAVGPAVGDRVSVTTVIGYPYAPGGGGGQQSLGQGGEGGQQMPSGFWLLFLQWLFGTHAAHNQDTQTDTNSAGALAVTVRMDVNNDGQIDDADNPPPGGYGNRALVLGVNDNDDDPAGIAVDQGGNQPNQPDCLDHIANGATDESEDFDDVRITASGLTNRMDVRLSVGGGVANLFAVIPVTVNGTTTHVYEYLAGHDSPAAVLKANTNLDRSAVGLATLPQEKVNTIRAAIASGTAGFFRIEGYRAAGNDNDPGRGTVAAALIGVGPSGSDITDSAPVYIAGLHILGSHYYGPIVNTDLPNGNAGFPAGTRVFVSGARGGADVAAPGVHVAAKANYYYVPAGIQHPYDVKPYDEGDNRYNPPAADDYFRDPDPNVPVGQAGHYRYRSRTQVLVRFGGPDPGMPLVGAGAAGFDMTAGSDFHRLDGVEFDGRHSTPPQETDVNGHIEAVNRLRAYLDVQAGVPKTSRWYTVEPDLDAVTLQNVLTKYDLGTNAVATDLLFLTHQGLYLPDAGHPALPDLRVRSQVGTRTKPVKGSRYKLALVGVDATVGEGQGAQPVTEANPYCTITAGTVTENPAMPDLRLRLTTGAGNEAATAMPPATATVTWNVGIRYQRGRTVEMKGASPERRDFYHQSATAVRPAQSPEMAPDPDPEWRDIVRGADGAPRVRGGHHIPFQYADGHVVNGPSIPVDWDTYGPSTGVTLANAWQMTSAMTALPPGLAADTPPLGSVIRGGTATLTWTLSFPNGPALAGRRAVQVLGSNPNAAQAAQYIGAQCNAAPQNVDNSFWFANAAIRHESRQGNTYYCQFNVLGTTLGSDVGPNFANIHGGSRPNFGYSNGWGLGQDDPPRLIRPPDGDGKDVIWNWKYSVQRVKTELSGKSREAIPSAFTASVTRGDMPDYVNCHGYQFRMTAVLANGRCFSYHYLDTMKRYNGGNWFVSRSVVDPVTQREITKWDFRWPLRPDGQPYAVHTDDPNVSVNERGETTYTLPDPADEAHASERDYTCKIMREYDAQ